MRRFLITGANGLLGREIIARAGKETQFVALTHDPEKLQRQFSSEISLLCYRWDQLDKISLDGMDAVIHCGFAREESGAALQSALANTANLLEKTGAKKIPFVGISSRSVYGQQENIPWTEDTPVSPVNMYALGKCAQELLVKEAGKLNGFPYTNIRLAGLIGIGMDARVVSKMTKSAIENGMLKVVGGSQQFAMLDIRDAAQGVLALLQLPAEKWKHTYNLGVEAPYSLIEMAKIVAQVVGEKLATEIPIQHEKKDISLLDYMDCSAFYRDTNWRPMHTLRDTVKQIMDFYVDQQRDNS